MGVSYILSACPRTCGTISSGLLQAAGMRIAETKTGLTYAEMRFWKLFTSFDNNGKQLFMFVLESFHGWNGGAQR